MWWRRYRVVLPKAHTSPCRLVGSFAIQECLARSYSSVLECQSFLFRLDGVGGLPSCQRCRARISSQYKYTTLTLLQCHQTPRKRCTVTDRVFNGALEYFLKPPTIYSNARDKMSDIAAVVVETQKSP